MLALLLVYLFVALLSQILGFGVSRLARWRFRNPLWYPLVGLLFEAVAARWYSLWLPLNGGFTALIGALAAASALRFGTGLPRIRWRSGAGLLLPAGALVLFLAAQQSISYDEALYHAAFIQWTAECGTVKGLANLHGRLGFNSTWHVFTAAFDGTWLAGRPLNALNGGLALWGLAFFGEEHRLRARPVAGWLGAFLFFPVLLVYHLIDPSADYAAFVFSLVLLYEVYHWDARSAGGRAGLGVCMVALLAFLLTVKLSCVPLLGLGLVAFGADLRRRHWLQLLGLCAVVVLPWLLANYWLSGYLIYPYWPVRNLQPAWKVPAAQAAADLQGIRWTPFQRWTGWSYAALEKASAWDRYRAWFGAIRPLDKLLFAGTPVLLLLSVFRRPDRYRLLALGTALAGFGVALWSAPDFRFIAPYTFLGAALLLSRLRLPERVLRPVVALAVCGQLAATLLLYHRLKPKVNDPAANHHTGLAVNGWMPEPYPKSPHTNVRLGPWTLALFDERKQQFNWNVIPGAYAPLPADLRLLQPKASFKGGLYRAGDSAATQP